MVFVGNLQNCKQFPGAFQQRRHRGASGSRDQRHTSNRGEPRRQVTATHASRPCSHRGCKRPLILIARHRSPHGLPWGCMTIPWSAIMYSHCRAIPEPRPDRGAVMAILWPSCLIIHVHGVARSVALGFHGVECSMAAP